MVVCKFFLQGRCKFGQNCKYEHQINDNTQNHSVSIMRQLQQQSPSPGNVDTNTLVRSAQNDMLNAEKGGQWILSSYAPFKDKPAFPGFVDKCFEEVRLGFYEASKSGNVEQYVQQLQAEIKHAILKSKALQNPSSEVVHVLTQIYNSPASTGSFASTQSFPERNSSNTLLQSSSNFNASKSIFSQNNQAVLAQPSVFAASNKPSVFSNTGGNANANATQLSLFNNNPAQNNPGIFGGGQKSIFAGAQQPYSNSVFGQQKSTLFNQPQTPPAFNSTFKQPFNTQASISPFSPSQAASNSPFNTQNSAPVFGVQNQPSNSPLAGNFITNQPSSIFNRVASSSPFNVQQQENNSYVGGNSPFNVQQSPPPQPNSIFANNQTATDFNSPRQQDSVFSATQQAPLSLLGGSPEEKPLRGSIFGGRNTSTLSIVNIDETVYSKMENLSESDIKAYQSDHFEFGNIPEKPPTLQMCF